MTIQVQAARYEGYTVWVNAMIESAGGEVVSGPEEISLEEEPTIAALETIGQLANSDAAPPDISTSDEDSARLAFEAGDAAFMINYTFAYGSAKENAPDLVKNIGAAEYPRVVADEPANPPLGGFNIGVSEFSENPEEAFDAAACIASRESQLTATELDGLPPPRAELYRDKVVRKAFPGFANVIRDSIAAARPRPLTPAYTDLSLAIQRTLHPPSDIDPNDASETYEQLREAVEDAVMRQGLL
jgi:multiple sugar transport system substrate-binding protein